MRTPVSYGPKRPFLSFVAQAAARTGLAVGYTRAANLPDCARASGYQLNRQTVLLFSDSVATPPACFTVLTGAKARAAWAEAKQNWIDCHPHVARTPEDPESDPAQCVANPFGGYSR